MHLEFKKNFKVLSTRLFAGQTYIRIYTDQVPDESFSLVEPNLEDVYFFYTKNYYLNEVEEEVNV